MRTFTFLFAVLLSTSIFAQAPQGVGYQGVAADSEGFELSNQSISIRASILSGSANGPIQWQETHEAVTDEYGLFSIKIGEGLSTGVGALSDFSEVSWGESSHFLQIEMDATGGDDYNLTSTSQMMSVPYALYAERANFDYDSLANHLSGDSAFVNKINTGLSGGGCDFSFPEGIGQVITEDILGNNPFIVPENKHLYITYFKNGWISSSHLPENEFFDPSSNNPNLPFVFGAGEGVRTNQFSGVSYFQGFLVDALSSLTPISDTIHSGGSYLIPSGKNLYILHWEGGAPVIQTNEFTEDFTQFENLTESSSRTNPLVLTSTQTLGTTLGLGGFSYFNGYLADEDYFAHCGSDQSVEDDNGVNENLTLQNCANQNSVNYQGYDYSLVGIGDQCWFAENLRAKNFNNGQPILQGILASDAEYYQEGIDPKRFDYSCLPPLSGNPPEDGVLAEQWFGLMYSGFCAVDDNVCPTGFHVPTIDEFETLMSYVGEEAYLNGAKLMDDYPWTFGSNETGFSARLATDRNSGGCSSSFDKAVFMSSEISNITEDGIEQAGRLEIDYNGYLSLNELSAVEWAAPIRCLKD